jgi:hypothetical protein
MTDIHRLKENFRQDTMLVPKLEGYTLENDKMMMYNNYIYVPPSDKLRSFILSKARRAVYIAHPRVTKMREDI